MSKTSLSEPHSLLGDPVVTEDDQDSLWAAWAELTRPMTTAEFLDDLEGRANRYPSIILTHKEQNRLHGLAHILRPLHKKMNSSAVTHMIRWARENITVAVTRKLTGQ